ncbi:hypothetical protein PP629_gp16 [Streptomyces phage Dubu]|uniref:Uncharacterized protein n=1 Tax=Streptomyces phage Dubu TaxID=2591226 RepID=A0A514DET3_9CAUD|nr:hypothetical protein PP629_gp16 [Streptomyces phage Dubu]QDH92121.1 hypothetical protein SEA_DUBU_16 [Streptomyces phage Dubu]
MAFPLDIRTELHLAGAWTDISSHVYVRDQKVISRGRRDQGASTDPSSLSLTLNNRDGRYSPRNAMSPLYGLIGRNTRVRLSVPGYGTPYLQMEADGSQSVTTPDAPALDLTGDMDIRAELAPNWYGPDNQMIVGKWDAATDQRSWVVRIESGRVYLNWSGDGTKAASWFAGRYLPRLPQRAAIRVTFDASNADGLREVRFYWAESLAGTWSPIGDPVVLAPEAPVPFSGSAPLSVGMYDVSVNPKVPRLPFAGRAYAFQVRSGIDGPLVAAPDFTAQAVGARSFTDSVGLVWTLNGGTEIRDREDRFQGEISSWPTEWSLDGSDVWTPIQASGILRRLGQGQKPFDSTLRRRIPSGDPVAYWPMEDDSTTTRAYSPLPTVEPASVTGLEFASVSDLVSSAPLPRLTASASLSAPIPTTMPNGAWQVEFVYNADDKAPADYSEVISFTSPNGTVRRWVISLKKGAALVRGYGSGTATVVDQAIGIGDDVFHGWVRLRFWVRELEGTPGTVEWRINWQDVGGDAGGLTRTYAGTVGRLSFLTAKWEAATEGWGIGHLTVLATADDALMNGSDDAFHGETAWDRLRRLASEERLPLSRIPGELEPERVGYQRQETLLNLLSAAATADGGMLLEDPRRVGLVYRDRSSLYTQEPKLVLSYTAPGLGPELQPVDDDSAVRNDITVTRDGGTAGRAFLDEGPLSLQPPPYGIGKYDEAVTLSLAHDTQPEPVANWRLHLGTFDGARYPTVSVTFHKPGAEVHIPAALDLHEGDLIRLTDLPPWVAHGDVDLIVEGWTETLDLYRWTIEFNCSPGGPWNTAVASHPTYAKVGTDDSTLASPVTATDTTLAVRTSPGPLWVTANPVLNVNPDFAQDLADWTGSGATLARVPTPAGAPFAAPWSMTVTPDGTSQYPSAGSGMLPVTAGQSFTLSGWASSSRSRNVALNLNWFDASFAYLSTSANDKFVAAGSWSWFELTATPPAGAVYANLAPTVPDFPPVTDVLTVGQVTFRKAGGSPAEFPIPLELGGEVVNVTAVSPALVQDTFSRPIVGAWGSADSGQAWTIHGLGTAADYAVNGTVGQHILNTRNVFRITTLDSLDLADVETLTKVTVPVAATGDGVYAYFLSRTDPTVARFYFARLYVSTTNLATLSLRKRTPTETLLATAPTSMPHTAGSSYWVRFKVEGSALMARAWKEGSQEPDVWQVTATDTDPLVPASGGIGLRSFIGSSNTNTLPVTVAFDDYSISDAQAFTVTRSVNGVTKPHAAATPVGLAFPAVASL